MTSNKEDAFFAKLEDVIFDYVIPIFGHVLGAPLFFAIALNDVRIIKFSSLV